MFCSRELSTTLDKRFCLDALQRALQTSRPEFFDTDQGAQFTSTAFVCALESHGIRVSMDSRGRVFDNIFAERFWIFDMDRLEIVAPGASGKAVFSGILQKWLLAMGMVKMFMNGGPWKHLHKDPQLSKDWGASQYPTGVVGKDVAFKAQGETA